MKDNGIWGDEAALHVTVIFFSPKRKVISKKGGSLTSCEALNFSVGVP